MKTVKIFLASSEELREERIMFGDFVNGLRRAFKPQGIDLELVKWEDLDSAFNGRCKEDEYIDKVKQCQLFVALFHTKAGMYTQQELDAACRSMEKYNVPAIFIFMKDLKEGETQTQELEALKEKILKEWRHFNDSYNHLDTLKLRFLQQMIIKLNDPSLRLEVEDSIVRFNNTAVASLDNVPFAANNDHYKDLKEDIEGLKEDIAELEEDLREKPNPRKEERLGKKRTELYKLREELAEYEKGLFATAQRIASIKTETMNDRLRRAIELFESGDNKGADALLDMKEIQQDIEWIKRDAEAARDNAKSIISQLTLKAQNLLTIYDNPNRIAEADEVYAEALDTAKNVRIDDKEMIELYTEYHKFLKDYALFEKALTIGEEWLRLARYVYGEEHPDTATSYNNIGIVYDSLGDYDKALEYYFKDLEISEKVLGKEHPDTATSYNNIGLVYDSLGDYDKALEYYFKALEIWEKVLGKEHPSTATSYNNIGLVYKSLGDYDKALEYYFKDLEISEKVLGKEHPDTATSYNNIGLVYDSLGDYDKALEYYFKALEILEKVLGKEHPSTATSYNNIGFLYYSLGDYDKALEYYFKALEIWEKVLGNEHPDTARSYNNIGSVYHSLGDYDKALEYYFKALEIREKLLGQEHPDTASSYNNIGLVYDSLGDYDKALKYYFKALEICEKVLPTSHPYIGVTLYNIAKVYEGKRSMEEAFRYMRRAYELGDDDARQWLEKHGESPDSLNK